MTLQLASINVGKKRRVGKVDSGIFKSPVQEPVYLGANGLVGDTIGDRRFHGGPDQAVYVYGGDDYDWWRDELQLDLAPGTFGENLTISGLSSLKVNVGDRLRLSGDVEIEATAPRIPCATLGARMGDPKFPIAFRRSQRCGFYARVLSPGVISAHGPVNYRANQADDPVAIVELFNLYYNVNPVRTELERCLSAPVATRERQRLEGLLSKMSESQGG